MLARLIRKYIGGIRLFITLLTIFCGLVIVICDMIFNLQVSFQAYTFLGIIVTQASVFIWKDTQRPTNNKDINIEKLEPYETR